MHKNIHFPKLTAFTLVFSLASQVLAVVPRKKHASLFNIQTTVPARIFTPNGDGVHDQFKVILDNPSGSIISEKKIMDLHGSEVNDFQVVGSEIDVVVTLVWDGRDKNGEYVRSGIYIFQVQAEGSVVNGTVVVAR